MVLDSRYRWGPTVSWVWDILGGGGRGPATLVRKVCEYMPLVYMCLLHKDSQSSGPYFVTLLDSGPNDMVVGSCW